MKTFRIVPVLVSLLFASACGEDAPTPPVVPSIATVTVAAPNTSLAPGETTQLTASATTASGQAVSGTQFTWLSEAPTVATVDATGKVSAVSAGTAVIAANAGAVRGTVTLSVKAPVPTTANLRFVNWTTGLSGSGGFTVNGQFISGSALSFGEASQTCTQLASGATAFAFGAANTGGTALSGNPLVALNNETMSAGGDYTLVATGAAASPTLLLLSNSFSGSLGTGSAAVRFISLSPPASGTTANFVFYLGDIGAVAPLALNLPFGVPSAYSIVASGTNKFSAMRTPGNVTIDPGSMIALLPASANTIALVPTAAGGAGLTRLPRCS